MLNWSNFYIMLKCSYVTINVIFTLKRLKVAGVKGLEPSTYRVTGDRSNQLSYTPTFTSFGG